MDLLVVLVDHLLKSKKKYKTSKKHEIHKIFIKINWIKLAFNKTWLMKIFNDLSRRNASDKLLHHKAFNIAKNPKYDGYLRGLASMVYELFYTKSGNNISGDAANSEILSKQEFSKALHIKNEK